MGKLSVYASKRKWAEIRKFGHPDKIKSKGHPRKRKPASATRDIDTTHSYSDEDTKSADEAKTHSFQFKVGANVSPKPFGAVGPGSSPSPSPSSSSSSSSTSSEEEEDIWTRPFVRNCYEELRSPQFVRNLIEVLYPAKCLPDFMLLVKQLASGDFSPTNIAFLLWRDPDGSPWSPWLRCVSDQSPNNFGWSSIGYWKAKGWGSCQGRKIGDRWSAKKRQKGNITPKNLKSTLLCQMKGTFGQWTGCLEE